MKRRTVAEAHVGQRERRRLDQVGKRLVLVLVVGAELLEKREDTALHDHVEAHRAGERVAQADVATVGEVGRREGRLRRLLHQLVDRRLDVREAVAERRLEVRVGLLQVLVALLEQALVPGGVARVGADAVDLRRAARRTLSVTTQCTPRSPRQRAGNTRL